MPNYIFHPGKNVLLKIRWGQLFSKDYSELLNRGVWKFNEYLYLIFIDFELDNKGVHAVDKPLILQFKPALLSV